MSLRIHTTPQQQLPDLSASSLQLFQLNLFADEILDYFQESRPEFHALATLQRACGCRITELFQPYRWTAITENSIRIEPQKGNAIRTLPTSELGYNNVAAMSSLFADMQRLTKTQYMRCFARAVNNCGLWRLYDGGFAHPSSHFFRHLKVKNLAAQNFSVTDIATYIGEKNEKNLDYYLNSQYYAEMR